MTLAELRTMTRAFVAYDLDTFDEDFQSNDTKTDAVINWALRSLSARLNLFNPSVTFTPTVSGQIYDLRGTAFAKRMLTIASVTVSGQQLRGFTGRLGLHSPSEFEAYYPRWREASASIPSAATIIGDNLIFNCPFSSGAVSATPHRVGGRILATNLTTAGQVPELPVETHESIAYIASVKATLPNVTEEEGFARLKAYSESQADLIEQLSQRQIATLGGSY